MSDLTGLGAITYGNFSFGNGPRVNSHVELNPVYDKAERTVIATKYVISVRALITSDDGTQQAGASNSSDTADTVMAKLERELMVPGKALTYTGWGHGTFAINSSATTTDVAFGPKPRYAKVELIGSTLAMQVTWVVEVTINRCNPSTNALYGRIGDLSSINYAETFAINERGLTVKTITGHLSITNNRDAPGTNTASKTADAFRHRFKALVPLGFKRIQNDWALDADKSTINFTIIDREYESAEGYPPGVTDITFDHTSTFAFRSRPAVYSGDIAGSVAVVKTFPLGSVWSRVLLMIRTRLTRMRNSGSTVIITGITIKEHMFDHRISFSVKYLLTVPESLINLAKANAQFTGSPTTSDSEHYSSLANTVYHNRGLARLEARGDKIVDPCNDPGSFVVFNRLTFNTSTALGGSLGNELPPPSKSYLMWDNWLEVLSEPNQVTHRIMQPKGNLSPRVSAIEAVLSLGGNLARAAPAINRGIGSTSNMVTQIDGTSTVLVKLKGKAFRAGYEPELPSLIKIWDRDVNLIPGRSKSDIRIATEMAGLPVYQRRWVLSYRVDFRTTAELQRAIRGGLKSAVLSTPDDLQGFKVLHGANTPTAFTPTGI